MARPIKQGIDYFSFDVDFFSDIKVRKIIRGCGPNSTSVLICLLCNIYKTNGYYIGWDKDLPFVIADLLGVSEGVVDEVKNKAIQVGFFNKDLYDKYQILTSEGIQKRFLSATSKRKEINLKDEYLVIDVKNSVITVNNPVASVLSTPITPLERVNDSRSTQSKVKESNKEIYKESKPPKSEAPARPKKESLKINYEGLVELFNRTFEGKIPTVRGPLSEKRKRAIKARIEEHNKETVMEVFQKVLHSSFLLGRTGGKDSNWKCSFDFIFSPSGFQKILEGNYDDEKSITQVRNDRREEERQQIHQEQTKRNHDRATYAINPFQLVKLRELKMAGNETATKLLSGEIQMTNIEITKFLKSIT